MVKKREGHKVVVPTYAQDRIDNDCCPTCGKPKNKWNRRTDWRCCSTECTDKFWREIVITSSWADLRKKAFERDNHRCIKCNREFPECHLIGDHIIPIALGGDEWDINNIQTLCEECNKVKTREDTQKIAQIRRVENKLIDGQKQLV